MYNIMTLSLFGTTYSVNKFLADHPGGPEVIRPYIDKDASHVFAAFHSKHAYSLLRELPKVIATTDEMKKKSSFDNDIHTLKGMFTKQGYFIPCLWFYLRKCIELHVLLAASIWLNHNNWSWTSSATLGLFFQQAGWLSHDCLHQSVFMSRGLNYWLGGMYVGALLQGLSPRWWVEKHARHHAFPNGYLEDDATGEIISYDEDIDTVPLLLWAPHLKNKMSSKMLPYQHVYFIVILMMSKWWWNGRSLVLAWTRRSWVEYYVLLFHLFLFTMVGGFWWYVRGMIVGGFLVSSVFVQSHNTRPAQKNPEEFYTTQVRATRNLPLDIFTTWFTGGLNYQIEHHLFPRMPRHNFSHIQSQVEQTCLKHGLKYETVGLWKSWQTLVNHLFLLGR